MGQSYRIDSGKTIFVYRRLIMKFQVLIFLFFAVSFSSIAQQHPAWDGFGIEVNAMSGKIFKHTKKFVAPVPQSTNSFEVNFLQHTYGKNDWEQRRHYPIVGLGFAYTNYGIDSIYGRCVSIFPNLQMPIISGKKLSWTFRVGFGLGYVSRHYERAPIYDTLNNAIGSHFNNYTVFTTDLRYQINKHWDVQLGGNFSHISNAALRTPNLGINFYGAHLGLTYFPINANPEIIKKELTPLKNRWLVECRGGIAGNSYGNGGGPLYPVYLFSAYASKRYASKNKVFFGLDYSYHTGIYAFLRNNELMPGEEKQNSWKSAVFVGNEFLIGRFGIMLQVGVYTHQAALKLDPYYEKLGTNIYLIQREHGLLKELFTSVLLKTHKTQAELVEIGLGAGF